MLNPLRNKLCRSTAVYAMVLAMIATVVLPFLRPDMVTSSGSAAEWLRKKLHVTADENFYRAFDTALASSPASVDEFVEAFVREYENGSGMRSRLATAFGFSTSALRYFLGSRAVFSTSFGLHQRVKGESFLADSMPGLSPRFLSLVQPGAALSLTVVTLDGAAVIASLTSAVPNGP